MMMNPTFKFWFSFPRGGALSREELQGRACFELDANKTRIWPRIAAQDPKQTSTCVMSGGCSVPSGSDAYAALYPEKSSDGGRCPSACMCVVRRLRAGGGF